MDQPDEPHETTPLIPKRRTVNDILTEAEDQEKAAMALKPFGKYRLIFVDVRYEMVMGAMIALNAVVIGATIDHPEKLPPNTWHVIHYSLFLFWTLEVLAKGFIFGPIDFFFGSQRNWNIFDFVITVLAACELGWVSTAGYETMHGMIDGDFVQVLRLFRLLRLGRIFPALQVLSDSLVNSVVALGWVFAFGGMWFFLCACIGTAFIGRRVFNPSGGVDELRDIREYFATIPMTMFTLFEIMTIEGWNGYARPLMHNKAMFVFIMVFFIFSVFFLMNLITAVVVDKTLSAQVSKADELKEKEVNKDRMLVGLLMSRLRELNGGNDHISKDQLGRHCDNEYVAEVLKQLGWQHRGMQKPYILAMFVLCKPNHRGEVVLARLENLIANRHQELTTSSYVDMEMNMTKRLQHLEKLNVGLVRNLERISGNTEIASLTNAPLSEDACKDAHLRDSRLGSSWEPGMSSSPRRIHSGDTLGVVPRRRLQSGDHFSPRKGSLRKTVGGTPR